MRTLSMLALALGVAAPAWSGELADSAFRAMRADRCEEAVDVVNKGLAGGDVEAYYLTGLMYLKGLCLAADSSKAQRYFEPAAKAGNANSARYLTMMHGLGLDVPQSYAQAGRWMQAWIDILRLSEPGATLTPGETLDAGYAERMGVVGTVAAVLQDRVQYPRRGASVRVSEVNVVLVLDLGPEGFRYRFADDLNSIEDDIQGSVRRHSNAAHLEAIETVLDKLLEELPPYSRPARSSRVAIPFRFRLL
jgi:hypothetical protein